MGKSLQDQLLKAGLANEHRARQASSQRRKQERRERGGAKDTSASAADIAARSHAEKVERDRALNQAREAARAARARQAQAADLLQQNTLNDPRGGITFHYTIGTTIRRLSVTEAQRHDLSRGRMAIVWQGERGHLVSKDTLDRLLGIDPETAYFRIDAEIESKTAPAADDPYAQYVVPEDLIW